MADGGSDAVDRIRWEAPSGVAALEWRHWYRPALARALGVQRLALWAVLLGGVFWIVLEPIRGDWQHPRPENRWILAASFLIGGLAIRALLRFGLRLRYHHELPPAGSCFRWTERGQLREVPFEAVTGVCHRPHPLDPSYRVFMLRYPGGWIPSLLHLPEEEGPLLHWLDARIPRVPCSPAEDDPVDAWIQGNFTPTDDSLLSERARWTCGIASLLVAPVMLPLTRWAFETEMRMELLMIAILLLGPATLLVPLLANGPGATPRDRFRAMLGRHEDRNANRLGARLRLAAFTYNMLAMSIGFIMVIRDLVNRIASM